MARIPDPIQAGLQGEAAEVYQEMLVHRGRIDGMYRSLLNHPRLVRKIADLGVFFRFGDSVLPDADRELVILHVAAALKAPYEWVKHEGPAREAGLPGEVIDSLRSGGMAGLDDAQRDLLLATDHLLGLTSIPEDLQQRIIDIQGLQGLVELSVLVGFYRLVAGVLAGFDAPLPEGGSDPFTAD